MTLHYNKTYSKGDLMKTNYPYLKEGESVIIPWKTADYKLCCCDCGLVHRYRFEVKGNNIIMKGWRDNRATGQIRRKIRKDNKNK